MVKMVHFADRLAALLATWVRMCSPKHFLKETLERMFMSKRNERGSPGAH
jgi:hypothetical protein